MIVAFDSNVLIYAADPRWPEKQVRALSLLSQPGDAVLLWQVACEFIAAARKLAPYGFTSEEAWDQLDYYLDAFPLVFPSRSVLQRARELHLVSHVAYWDAMIVSACIEAGVGRLYSEDLPGSASPPGLELVNPFT